MNFSVRNIYFMFWEEKKTRAIFLFFLKMILIKVWNRKYDFMNFLLRLI
jgi:hypothetical protein